MLEKGSAQYHQPVLKLLYEYLRLQDSNSVDIKQIADTIMTIATQHIKVQSISTVYILHTCGLFHILTITRTENIRTPHTIRTYTLCTPHTIFKPNTHSSPHVHHTYTTCTLNPSTTHTPHTPISHTPHTLNTKYTFFILHTTHPSHTPSSYTHPLHIPHTTHTLLTHAHTQFSHTCTHYSYTQTPHTPHSHTCRVNSGRKPWPYLHWQSLTLPLWFSLPPEAYPWTWVFSTRPFQVPPSSSPWIFAMDQLTWISPMLPSSIHPGNSLRQASVEHGRDLRAS